ncbi:MAG: NfeD family protein [Thermonemataceae bacterium]
MDEYISIGLLVVIGLVLIIVEVLFVPGTTFVGIIGFILGSIGIYLGFQESVEIGWTVLGTSATISGLAFYFSFKRGLWRRFALNTQQTGNVSHPEMPLLQVGEVGKTVSALRPSGTAEFKNTFVQVRTLGNFVDNNSLIKIIQIEKNKIWVAPISEEIEP